jgi:hypothetical protein
MTEAIYALLKRDAEVMSKVLPGQEPPAPLLYDPAVHRQDSISHPVGAYHNNQISRLRISRYLLACSCAHE